MRKRVLIVDDDSAVRRVLRKLLEGLSCEVLESGDGAGCAEIVWRERPDLVLLDIHLPRLDGVAALTAVSEMMPQVPVIMLTGDPDSRRAELALERGACDFMTKPFDFDRLRAAIRARLEAGK